MLQVVSGEWKNGGFMWVKNSTNYKSPCEQFVVKLWKSLWYQTYTKNEKHIQFFDTFFFSWTSSANINSKGSSLPPNIYTPRPTPYKKKKNVCHQMSKRTVGICSFLKLISSFIIATSTFESVFERNCFIDITSR